jgi:hypothetical protein
VLGVASLVALGVLGVDLGHGVEGLMDVANVVDDQSQGEGLLVGRIAELVSDSLQVGGVLDFGGSLKEANQVSEGADDVNVWHDEVGEVLSRGAILIEVGDVDEVPLGLEGVALALDVVGERSALGEGVVFLVFGQRGVVLLED